MALFAKFLISPKMLEFLHRASNVGSRGRLHPSSKTKTELTHTRAELLPTEGRILTPLLQSKLSLKSCKENISCIQRSKVEALKTKTLVKVQCLPFTAVTLGHVNFLV